MNLTIDCKLQHGPVRVAIGKQSEKGAVRCVSPDCEQGGYKMMWCRQRLILYKTDFNRFQYKK